jgi:Cytochrome P450
MQYAALPMMPLCTVNQSQAVAPLICCCCWIRTGYIALCHVLTHTLLPRPPLTPLPILQLLHYYYVTTTTATQGADIFLALYNIHRSPEFWENPDVFDPSRFLKPFTNPGCEGWAGYNPQALEGQLYPNEVSD